MMEIAIPYGGYWSSPFAKWQGKLAHLHSLRFAAHVAKHSLELRGIEPAVFDFGVLGMTVPQKQSFYGLPWLMGEIGADRVTGPTINQACATSARILETASSEISSGHATVALAIAADRTSNGPHLYYPAPAGPGELGKAVLAPGPDRRLARRAGRSAVHGGPLAHPRLPPRISPRIPLRKRARGRVGLTLS